MSEHTADTINQMLKGVVEDGTGTQAGLSDRDNAGKTGTTDERKNAWFVGYTPNLSTAVWVGSDGAHQNKMIDITIGGQYYDKVCGGCLPGPIWRTAMTGALSSSETPSFNAVDVPRSKPKEDKDKGGDKKKPGDDDEKPGGDDNPFPGISIPPDILGGNNGHGRGQNGGTNGP